MCTNGHNASPFGCPFALGLGVHRLFRFCSSLRTSRLPSEADSRGQASRMATEELHMDALSVSDAGMDDDDV